MNIAADTSTVRVSDVRTGVSTEKDPGQAVAEFVRHVSQPGMALVVVFASPEFDRRELAAHLVRSFPDCPVIGCTTSGEITPGGYSENSLTGFSLSGAHAQVTTCTIGPLKDLQPLSLHGLSQRVKERVAGYHQAHAEARDFALFFVDGMSGKEEDAVALVHQALGDIPLIGGSAGDNLDFDRTWVLSDGEFVTDAAVLAVVSTVLPFETFKTQHFLPTDTKLVITEADPSTRTVYEINGLPAAEEYARLIGIAPDELVPTVFSRYPVMLRIGGEYYVRSLQRRNADGSLTFYCAIDNGLVLTIARGVDIVENLREALAGVAAGINQPQLLITCECVLRRLEVIETGLTGPINDILVRHGAIGFHSYGEQFNAIHVNQTFSGVMVGQMS